MDVVKHDGTPIGGALSAKTGVGRVVTRMANQSGVPLVSGNVD